MSVICVILNICPTHLGYITCWQTIFHGILMQSLIYVVDSNIFSFIFLILMAIILKNIYFYFCSRKANSIFTQPWLPEPPIPISYPWTCCPLSLCPCVLYPCSLITLPLFPSLSLSPLPSGYCQFVLYFNVSGYILLLCLVD